MPIQEQVKDAGGLREQFEKAIELGGVIAWAGYKHGFGEGGSGRARRLVPLKVYPGEVNGETRDLVLCYSPSHDNTMVDEATGEVVERGQPFRQFILKQSAPDSPQGFTQIIWANEVAKWENDKAPLVGVAAETRRQGIHPLNPAYDRLATDNDRWEVAFSGEVAGTRIVIQRILAN